MLSYEDALARILVDAETLGEEEVPVGAAAGRYLSRPLPALFDQPPFNASAMDGYAVRWKDMPGPWHLVGESAAGMPFAGTVDAGEAVRIFTGAPLPDGADTVLVQEDCEASGSTLRLTGDGPAAAGTHIRPRGNDFAEGATLLPPGSRLTPAALSLAAAAGHGGIWAARQPRVALLATGDELVSPGNRPGPAQIVASSGVAVSAILSAAGAIVDDLGIVPDDMPQLVAALEQAKTYDLCLTIGGASVGEHDLVRGALAAAGAELDFWRIAIKPGKPLIHGRLGRAAFIGLPGNPVSAYVCALLFAEPLVAKLQGAEVPVGVKTARLAAPLPENGSRRDHLRAVLTEDGVRALETQDSAQLAVLARADVLIVRAPGAEAAEAGAEVPIIPLDRS